ncbi:MAG TPA: ATP-binding cassette domain-containing protein [Roseiarcus sp.]|nr:ATP-binding cassette domain-containing protein [Roseiarcus sp.]
MEVLSDVSIGVRAGDVHAIVGENGAGRSTLMKILSAGFIEHHIIRVTEKAFDDFARRRGRQEADQARAWTEVREEDHGHRGTQRRKARRQDQARHGWRRRGRLHRRGPPHRLAHRRSV